MRALPLRTTLPAAVLACLAVTAGCGGRANTPAAPPAGDSPAAPSSSDSSSSTPESPATTSDTTGTTASPSPTSASAPTSLADRLLATSQVPGLTATWRWHDGRTGPASTDAFGSCAKADLGSIGATQAVERTYFPPDDSDDNAAEQIAEFPDANTAARVWAVLGSWHDRCARTITHATGVQVGALQALPVSTGQARWYLVSWKPTGEETNRFETFGMVLDGTRIALLRMDHSARAHVYPAGQDPMVGMVKRAAGTLG